MNDIVLVKFENNIDILYPPFGILCIANALEKSGYSVSVFHEKGTPNNIQRLLKPIEEGNVLFIGFSAITGPQLAPVIKASKLIKQKMPDLPIVWGGIHPTLLAEQCLSEYFVDMVIMGEGEETALELSNALKYKSSLEQIKGLGYKEKRDIRINGSRDFIDLDSYSPSWNSVNLDRYFKKKWGFKRVLPMLLSRGCPHKCGFCYNLAVNRKVLRILSFEKSIQEIEKLKRNYAIDGLMFYDDSLFTNSEMALEIIKRIGLPWFSEIRADYVDELLMEEIVKYNCQELYIGAESGSQRILDIIQKDIKVEDIVRCVKLCKKYSVELNLSFMTGIPGEHLSDTQITIDFIDYLSKIYPKVNIEFKIYTPYPGTPLWIKALEYGLKEPRRPIDWTSYQRGICNLPWIKNSTELETMCYACSLTYNQMGLPKSSQLKNILKIILIYIEKLRWKNRFFRFPIELQLFSFIKLIKEYGYG